MSTFERLQCVTKLKIQHSIFLIFFEKENCTYMITFAIFN